MDISQIPVEQQQAIAAQLGIKNMADVQAAMAQLSQNPEQLAAVMKQLGISVPVEDINDEDADTPEEEAAETPTEDAWEDEAADQVVDDGESATDYQPPLDDEAEDDVEPSVSSSAANKLDAEAAEADAEYADEGDTTPEPEDSVPAEVTPTPAAQAQSMPRTRGNVTPMDDIISAAMMEQATGNPNAPVPGASRLPPTTPAAGVTPALRGAPSPTSQQMIAQIYRQIAAQQAGQAPRRGSTRVAAVELPPRR
jgi:hypothetical protein